MTRKPPGPRRHSGSDETQRCSFCNKTRDEVEMLIQYERDHASLWGRIFHHRHTGHGHGDNRRAA